MEWWIGMEWNGGMTTPTERGFVTTYPIPIVFCNCSRILGKPVAVSKKDELKLIQEEEERSITSKLTLKWAIQLPIFNKC
jgi:hypothetical protein